MVSVKYLWTANSRADLTMMVGRR